jgi:hypothetical protein
LQDNRAFSAAEKRRLIEDDDENEDENESELLSLGLAAHHSVEESQYTVDAISPAVKFGAWFGLMRRFSECCSCRIMSSVRTRFGVFAICESDRLVESFLPGLSPDLAARCWEVTSALSTGARIFV